MDACIRFFRNPIFRLVSPLLAMVLATPGIGLAGDSRTCGPWYCPLLDDTTLCAWHRTWHGPDTLATPLTGYYIPRVAPCCEFDGCAGGCGDAVAEYYVTDGEFEGEFNHPGDCCFPDPAIGFEPVQFERLGTLPNDLELNAGAVEGAPGRTGR